MKERSPTLNLASELARDLTHAQQQIEELRLLLAKTGVSLCPDCKEWLEQQEAYISIWPGGPNFGKSKDTVK